MKKMETLELEITELRMENEQLKVENNSQKDSFFNSKVYHDLMA